MTTNELQVNRNMSVSDGGRQSSSLDLDSDGRQYSSTAKKVRQPIISKLLRTSDDEEFDWMNDEIEIEPIVKKIDGKVEEKVNSSSKKKMQMDDSSNTSSNLSSDHEFLISDENIPVFLLQSLILDIQFVFHFIGNFQRRLVGYD